MNRLKKEFRKRGIKLECDYPMIPYDEGSQSVLGVYVNCELPKVIIEYNSLAVNCFLLRNGKLYFEVV